MERSIRIGKDFNVRWSIHRVVDGERQPYELAGKELVLQYRTPYGLKEATEWKVVGNTIIWTFRGKEQKALGSYELILTENGSKDGMMTVDTCRAFKLVAHSCEETEGSGSDIVIEDVVLESEVAFAPVVIKGGGGSYDDTAIWEALASLEQLIEDLQNMKIDRENDDYYPKMAVGLADNLAGVDVVDSEINFRRSGGGAITDGVARIESIKGNSVVWNEIFKAYAGSVGTKVVNGVTFTFSEEGHLTAEGTAEGASAEVVLSTMPLIGTHKYLILVPNMAVSSWGNVALYAAGYNTDANQSQPSNGWSIFKATDTAAVSLMLTVWAGKSISLNTRVSYYDLTKMFGSGNEPTTIEEFYQRRPMGVDLNAYNEGEVIHMDVQSIESQGVNAWDEEWENGTFNITTGANINGQHVDAQIRSKNAFAVVPSADYSTTTPMWVIFTDREHKVVEKPQFSGATSGNSIFASPGTLFKTPSNAAYMRFYLLSNYGSATYNHDICINLSDPAVDGIYFPYIKRQEDLSIIRKYFPQGMKSAGSAHDEIRYNKTTQKWEKVVRIGEVDLGALDYIYQPPIEGTYPHGYFFTQIQGKAFGNSNLLCGKYSTIVDWVSIGVRGSESSTNTYIKDSAYTSITSLKAAMAGVMLYYELAEPIVTELDEADQFKDLDYAVWNAGTEKAIADGKSAPLAADITYGFNAIGKIKELESLVAALRAKVGI